MKIMPPLGCGIALMFAFVAEAAPAAGNLLPLAERAVAGDAEATGRLRQAGPEGLQALLLANRAMVDDLRGNRVPLDSPAVAGLRQALDAVARQRDAYASGLYWFTDLEAAKAEAKRTGKLIVSLRLLGNLHDEYSCANSRFFRTVLYANAEVSKELRDHYILHWKSVRPAPLITIDMGDGRRIKRTITGNSIHYVLDAEGTVIDALPGLYGPKAFLAGLERAGGVDPRNLEFWHGIEAYRLREEFLREAIRAGAYGFKPGRLFDDTEFRSLKERAFVLRKGGEGPPNVVGEMLGKARSNELAPPDTRWDMKREIGYSAWIEELVYDPAKGDEPAIPLRPDAFQPPAGVKAMVERPILKQIMPDLARRMAEATEAAETKRRDDFRDSQPLPPLVEVMTPALWKTIAGLHANETSLDESSRRFMMAKLPQDSISTGERKTGEVSDEQTPFARTLRHFEQAVAEDTVRNEFLMHTQIHLWLEAPANQRLSHDVDALNKKVYAELFLTPDYDEWLGLVPEDTYTALEKDGCACDKGAPPMRK